LFLIMLLVVSSIVSAVNIENVNSVEIEPGKTSVISISIKNDHGFDVEDVSIILDLSEELPIAPYYTSAEVFIGKLDEGDEESVSFDIIASANAAVGLYKIPVLISYSDEENESYTKTDFISVLIKSVPKLDLSLDDPNYVVGSKATLSVKLVNFGLSDIKFLKVKILNSQFYNVISPREIYVGDLDSDDFDNIDFDINFDYPLPTKVNLPINVEYYDSNNNYYNERIDLEIPIYSKEQAMDLGLMERPNFSWIVITIIVVALFIGYKIRKKRKKRKTKE